MPITTLAAGARNGLTILYTDGYQYLQVTGELYKQFTESHAALHIRRNLTASCLSIKLNSNTLDQGEIVFTLRKNGVLQDQSVTIDAGQVGWFRDTSNTTSLSSGDYITVRYHHTGGPTSGSTVVGYITLDLEEASSHYSYMEASSSQMIEDNQTIYLPFCGLLRAQATESWAKATVPMSLTWRYMGILIASNANDGTITVRSRVNDANGNQTFTVDPEATGFFYDNSNSDSLSAGNEIDIQVVLPDATGGAYTNFKNSQGEFDGGSTYFLFGAATNDMTGFDADQAANVAGRIDASSPESATQFKFPRSNYNYTVDKLYMWINVNTSSATTHDWYIRKNGANGNIQILNIGTGTGEISDTSNSDTFTGNSDNFNWRMDWDWGPGTVRFTGCFVRVKEEMPPLEPPAIQYHKVEFVLG